MKTSMSVINATLVKTLREKTGAGVIACKKALEEAHGDLDAAFDRLRAEELANAEKKADRVASEGLVGLIVEGRAGAIVELNTQTDFVARSDAFRGAAAGLATAAFHAHGDLAAVANSPSPDGDGLVSDLIVRLTSRTGERVNLRRSGFVSVSEGLVAAYVHNSVAPGLGSIGVLVGLESEAPAETLRALGHDLAMHIAASAPQWVSQADIPPDLIAEKRAELTKEARATGKPAQIVEKMVDGRLRKFCGEVALMLQPFVLNPDQLVEQAFAEAEKAAGAAIAIRSFVRFKVGEGIVRP